jgi:hypothetical protein
LPGWNLVRPQNLDESIPAVKSNGEVRMKGMLGILVVALISLLAYHYYFAKAQSGGTGTPVQTINIVGVKNDLIALAQAERGYQAEHGGFASLDELTSSGALTMQNRGRMGYSYEIENAPGGFKAVAHCPTATNPGCTDYFVDQTMEVQSAAK